MARNIVVSFIALFFSHSVFAGLSFDLAHTVQNCNHQGRMKTWCVGSADADAMAQLSGLQKKIVSQLDRALINPSRSRVFISEFSFSDKVVQAKVCQLGKAGVLVRVFVDHGSSGDVAFAKNPECQKNPSQPNLIAETLGGFATQKAWRLHHNKAVLIDAGNGSAYDIDFSSGNLSKFGLSLHMDHWVMMKAPADSNIARSTLCLFESLSEASAKAKALGMYSNNIPDISKDPAVMSHYQLARSACFKKNAVIPMEQPEAALAKEGVAAFYTPNIGSLALKTFLAEISKVPAQKLPNSYIYIAIEHFSLANIAQALHQAANAGVDVRILLNSGTVTGSTESPLDKPFYDKYLSSGRIKVRFIETNPAAGGNGQQMHNKFALLNGVRVFSGAGHYTNGGLVNNFETLYLTQNDELNRKYNRYFKSLWDVSVDEAYLTKPGTSSTPPPPLSPRFLQNM